MLVDGALLRLQHHVILIVYALAVVDMGSLQIARQLLVVGLEGPHEIPEIMATRLGFRRDGGEEGAVDALGTVALARPGPRRRDPDVADHDRRRLEIHDLPSIDAARLAQLLGPERRRIDVDHPARHGRGVLGVRHVERRVEDGVVADAVGMHVGLVRQIHQIVDHQAIVAFEAIERAALAFPFGAVVPVKVRQDGGIGSRGIAGPDPDQPMPLDHGIGAHAGRRIDGLLRGHETATSRRIEDQTVVAAHDLIADEPSERKRQQPMPAGILQRDGIPVRAAIEHDVLAADRSRRQFALDLVAPGGGIPSVQRKGSAVSHRCPPEISALTPEAQRHATEIHSGSSRPYGRARIS